MQVHIQILLGAYTALGKITLIYNFISEIIRKSVLDTNRHPVHIDPLFLKIWSYLLAYKPHYLKK